MKTVNIPIWEKFILTVEEASEYSNIGRDKLYELCKNPSCTFVLKNGRNILIKRKEFEKYLSHLIFI